MQNKFTESVCEKIKYYVYALKNPLTDEYFYVGKGKGNRIFKHVSDAIENPKKSDKVKAIKQILKKNKQVEHFIIRSGLSEKEAHEIEASCIELLGLKKLTNLKKGHGSTDRGLKTIDEVIAKYDAKKITVTEPAVIININKFYERFMTSEEIYKVTHKRWRIGKKRKEVQYALAAYRGIVREVFKVHGWYKDGERWGFRGEVAGLKIRSKYYNQSLAKYIQHGNQNPIRYTF